VKEFNSRKIQAWYAHNKASSLVGRWIPYTKIEPLLKKLKSPFEVSEIGKSEQGVPIHKITIGSGKIRILMWSQMHGNESTGTKAIFDLINFFQYSEEFNGMSAQILSSCTLTIVPMLNPDGALAYTRINASGVDLNRDAVDLKAVESVVLKKVLDEVNPQYCFNLHDQRTIFTVGATKKPATLSFLAPSINERRSVTRGRKETMCVIVAMNELIQQLIPGQVGRYTDEFYPTATGDNFQKAGHNTILIEAGHYQDDYQREQVRWFNFVALLKGINFISTNKREQTREYAAYFDIPNNSKFYLDIIYKNVFLKSQDKKVDVGVLFKEELKEDELIFNPSIEQIGDLSQFAANLIIDKKGIIVKNESELKKIVKK
tara:strand:- start:325405 stop:326526 length:1122 start_codon:yes stop_codon:yes gene_type:complete